MRKTILLFIGLWIATTLYILLFPTRHYTADAVNNLVFIEQQNQFELWHSQHLLAQWPGYWLYQAFGGQIRAWEAMRYAHALLAGATVALVFAAILELTSVLPIALVSGLVLWFSYGFWHYQSDPDIYSAGYAAVALLLLAYVRYLHRPTTRRLWGLGLAAALAMLVHQLNLEWAGLIGLSLIWLAGRPAKGEALRVTWRQVGLYALICAVIVGGVYVIGYLNASAALVQAGGSQPPFIGWVLGYFNKAQAGQATWGVSLQLNTLPLAGYTFVLSWILPPLLSDLSIGSGALLGLLLVGGIVMLVHGAVVLKRLPRIPRLIIIGCGLTLLINGFSGWWWQAGNVKFYLFMQINLIVLAALYAQSALSAPVWQRRISWAAISAVLLALTGIHVLLTLPYETQGGLFAVRDAVGDEQATVWFDTAGQAEIFRHLSSQPVRLLPKGFCETPPPDSTAASSWWVVKAEKAANCTILTNASLIGSFQADRSRQVWMIYHQM